MKGASLPEPPERGYLQVIYGSVGGAAVINIISAQPLFRLNLSALVYPRVEPAIKRMHILETAL
jgi:hypothetical protein